MNFGDYCTWKWETINGVNGRRVKGPNGNSIFLPAAGYRNGNNLLNANEIGDYWASLLDGSENVYGYGIFFNYTNMGYSNNNRANGQSVRPVRQTKSSSVADVHDYVDLGLPSGLKWATCNIGASTPEENGLYFAWGETSGYDKGGSHSFDWRNYKWCNGTENTLTKYCYTSGNGAVDNKRVLDIEDDAAHENWGGDWRIPTSTEQEELINNCTCSWIDQNGVYGLQMIGPNGNSIFLPASGYRANSSLINGGTEGGYWSSNIYTGFTQYAFYLIINSNGANRGASSRERGLLIRPVCP